MRLIRSVLFVLVPLINACALRALAGKLRRGEVLVRDPSTGQVLPKQRWRRGMARRIARSHLTLTAKRFQRFTVRRLFRGRRESRYLFDRRVSRRTVALRKRHAALRDQLAKVRRKGWWQEWGRIYQIEAQLAVRPRLAALAAEVASLRPARRRLRVA